MLTHWMEIVHNHDNGCRDWLFHYNVFPQRESTSIMSVNGKGFTLKGQLQRFYKLVSYERAVKILKNDICITEIGQSVLEIFEFKVGFPRKIPKIRILQMSAS